jgi:hypothetical protein
MMHAALLCMSSLYVLNQMQRDGEQRFPPDIQLKAVAFR